MSHEKVDKMSPSLDMYHWPYEGIPILDLRRWIDAQIEQGANSVRVDISWGYYNDIDGMALKAE